MDINNKFCAFIDILGFKNRMSDFDDAVKYYSSYFSAYEGLNRSHDSLLRSVSGTLGALENIKKDISIEDDVENLIFSDSIVMSSAHWKSMLFRLSNVMSYLLSFGFLFRGGIGYGKHYSEINSGKTQIVSEGLVQAVEIESKISVFPRIVVGQLALDEILRQSESLYDLNNMFIQSEDNLWFINPFFLNPDIESISKMMNQGIEIYESEKFVQKYYWMGELCNYFYMQKFVRDCPFEYYFNELLEDLPCKSSDCTDNHFLFFYPKIYHSQIFGIFNYTMDMDIYKKTFKQNIKHLIEQQASENHL